LQAAIWKVDFDPGNYDIQHGIFSISPDGLTGDNATYQAFIALADSYLASVSNGTFHAKGGTIVKQYTGTSPSGAKDQSFVVVNAPEPASLALLASGFVALAGLRRHRCQRPATAAG
jgi:hypothetical protein